MASNDAQQDNIPAIRQLLLAAFTPEELRRFCYDRPDLRPVVNRFGSRHSLEDMVDELITYCDNYRYLPELLAELKQHNPRQYAHYLERETANDKPALASPEILTIPSPISLQLVRVPAGEFQMGSVMARDNDAFQEELPPHRVHVPEFHIGQYTVTNRQYRALIRATGHPAPVHWKMGKIPQGKDNHPVVEVSWHDAVAFCDWLSRETGQPFRLPTEAEWEKAARGTDGRIYPWGDEPPDRDRCNFGRYVDRTTTMGRYSPQGDSPYGCADMAGNVWEWCQSLFMPYPYQAGDGREDLRAGGRRVFRGGSFEHVQRVVRCADRGLGPPQYRGQLVGFRVVVAAGPSDR
ncbi:MAG TPA: SUMF1/EgtB/PvdO family nonheme iron enzyme [Anaerolineae bacterium]|nr:SUMF1/EgtB/PvdO family nonheme iron enzyme [Anaerolineae bacterium]